MGRSSKQRASLKAKRMVSSDSVKSLFDNLPKQKTSYFLTFGDILPLQEAPHLLEMLPQEQRSKWAAYIPFTSSKDSDRYGIIFYNRTFSECCVAALGSNNEPDANEGGFMSMFGFTYIDIKRLAAIHAKDLLKQRGVPIKSH